ncbi:P2X purinoceptor 7-like [Hyperolius riggenbachi]|uniref:P2X purinoceptor 7-like n=1 Tax=Hyperolius riggenbachi TaxID=752182 RepID=UPI0035A311E9
MSSENSESGDKIDYCNMSEESDYDSSENKYNASSDTTGEGTASEAAALMRDLSFSEKPGFAASAAPTDHVTQAEDESELSDSEDVIELSDSEDVIEISDSEDESELSASESEESEDVPSGLLCKCGKCVPMDPAREEVCCKKVAAVRVKLTKGKSCITEINYFQNQCTNREYVETNVRLNPDTSEHAWKTLSNSELRKIAYRTFRAWIYRTPRKFYPGVIPSCAVRAIRKSFPDSDL